MKRLIVLLAAAALALTVLVGVPSRTPTASADPEYIFKFNPGICLALMGGATPEAIGSCGQPGSLDWSGGTGDHQLTVAADVMGNNNGILEPGDFSGADDFTGGQLHQQGGILGLSHLVIVVFVKNNAPVTFHTTEGLFIENNSTIYTCTAVDDPDCGGANAPLPLGQDRVVVAQLACTLATCPVLGEHDLTVEQDGVVYPTTFTVVGEARTVEFFTLETAVQAGLPLTVAAGASSSADCPFSADLAFITAALGKAEETVIVARALDINGTELSGAWFNFTVDDNSEAVVALPQAPTLNLGGFGYGAPNILCARDTAPAGSVTVTATLARSASGLSLDPGADPGDPPNALAFGTTTYTVNAIPAAMTLTASPSEIACDGSATSTVSAAIVDAAGNPALSGTAVHFAVLVLGTANPIDTVTNDKGIATTTVAPLAGDAKGVPVTVSVSVGGVPQGNLTQQILVNCTAAAAGPPPPVGGGGGAPSGGAGAGTSAPGGTITGPNTGSGGASASAGSASWWPMLGLLGGAIALVATRAGRMALDRRDG